MGKYTVIRSKVIHLMNQLNSLFEGNWKHTDNIHTLFNKLNLKKKGTFKMLDYCHEGRTMSYSTFRFSRLNVFFFLKDAGSLNNSREKSRTTTLSVQQPDSIRHQE